MATKPKKREYQIQYTDNTYRIVEWAVKEFKQVGESMVANYDYCIMDDGVFALKDIRTIILLPEVEEEQPQKDNKLTEWGFVDNQTALWLKEMGIDLGEVEN
jgi:hypothetical protein